jgi:hypothetical protein
MNKAVGFGLNNVDYRLACDHNATYDMTPDQRHHTVRNLER